MENNNKKLTIYQGLNQLLNLDGLGYENQTPSSNQIITSSNNNHIEQRPRIIIKGESPQDIQRKAAELQQKEVLKTKFSKSSERSFQKALQYEAARLPAYMDYEGMEYYPLIASALDLYMEEATTIGMNGKMLNIYSNKERIKAHLEELFYDIMSINVNLPFWTRNVTKYGDNFVSLYGERKKGLLSVRQMVNYDIERKDIVHNGKSLVKFTERITGNNYNIFEIGHFRLLADDKMLPYGSSCLSKIRRVFRQLVLAEDAMLTYRIVRAGEKKVFKIDVGNIDDDDVEEYIYKIASTFKRAPQVDMNNGQFDYRYNILGVDEDYFLPVRNGNTVTGIDTLQGAENLDKIQDIEYLRDNLFIGLSIPKPFLSFQDAAGGGKNMAQFDMRFAKKITRIQQAMIQELNKIATIHLYYLGFEKEDLGNFTLTLNNPSTQQELLKTELLREKATTYNELTNSEGGIAPMSHTEAKKLIFNMSDSQIIEDLKKQRMERAIAQELQDTPLIIKKTTIFDDIDKKYGDEAALLNPPQSDPELNQNEPSSEDLPQPGSGKEFQTPADLPPVKGESKNNKTHKKALNEKEYSDLVEKLVNGNSAQNNIVKNNEIIEENNLRNRKLNEEANNMINEIDKLLEKNNLNENNINIDLINEEEKD